MRQKYAAPKNGIIVALKIRIKLSTKNEFFHSF